MKLIIQRMIKKNKCSLINKNTNLSTTCAFFKIFVGILASSTIIATPTDPSKLSKIFLLFLFENKLNCRTQLRKCKKCKKDWLFPFDIGLYITHVSKQILRTTCRYTRHIRGSSTVYTACV